MAVDVFRADSPPNARRYGDTLTAGIVRGNMGSLVAIGLGPGLELAEHSHEQEHVGAVIAGEVAFFEGPDEVRLRAGDLDRVVSNQRHGVGCAGQAIVVQARAD